MVLGVRDDATFASLQKMFPDGVENQKPHSPLLAPAIIAKEFIRQAWDAVVNRYTSIQNTVRQIE
jgi:hypothetical protein